MSIEIMEEVMTSFPVGGDELVLAIVLADCATPEGELYVNANVMRWAAARARITEDAVDALMAKMEAHGWLYLSRRDTRGDIGNLFSFRAPDKHTLRRSSHTSVRG